MAWASLSVMRPGLCVDVPGRVERRRGFWEHSFDGRLPLSAPQPDRPTISASTSSPCPTGARATFTDNEGPVPHREHRPRSGVGRDPRDVTVEPP
jgi:hypothetical protein